MSLSSILTPCTLLLASSSPCCRFLRDSGPMCVLFAGDSARLRPSQQPHHRRVPRTRLLNQGARTPSNPDPRPIYSMPSSLTASVDSDPLLVALRRAGLSSSCSVYTSYEETTCESFTPPLPSPPLPSPSRPIELPPLPAASASLWSPPSSHQNHDRAHVHVCLLLGNAPSELWSGSWMRSSTRRSTSPPSGRPR